MHGKAQRVARPAQTRLQNSRVTGPKFTKFLTDVEWSSAVLTHAYTIRFSHSLWNASAQNDGGVCHFRRFAPKSVTIPTSLERSRKEGQTDHVNPYVYISWKFVKIGPLQYTAFWDSWCPAEPLKTTKVTSAHVAQNFRQPEAGRAG